MEKETINKTKRHQYASFNYDWLQLTVARESRRSIEDEDEKAMKVLEEVEKEDTDGWKETKNSK